MTMEQFIEEWAGKDWKNHTWEKDEIGVFQYRKQTFKLKKNDEKLI